MLPELSKVFDAPMSAVAQVVSMFAVGYGVMQLLYGPVGDRWGKYRVVILATLGCGIGCVLSALSNGLDQLVIARIATAIFSAGIIPMSLAWVGDAVDYHKRQETLARVGLGTMLGITSGQFFGGLLTDTLGWRWAFVMMACVFWTVSFLLWRHFKKLDASHHRHHISAGFFKQLLLAGKDAWVRTLLAIALIEGACVFGLLAITATHLHNTFGVSLTIAGSTAALFGLGGMVYMATAKYTIRKFGETGLSQGWSQCSGRELFSDCFHTVVATRPSRLFWRRVWLRDVSQHHAGTCHANGSYRSGNWRHLVCRFFIFRAIVGRFDVGQFADPFFF